MLQLLLQSELELIVDSQFIYVPLLYDPDIAGEVRECFGPAGSLHRRGPANARTAIESNGKYFVKSLNIQSILANYDKIDKKSYEQLKRLYLGEPENPREPVALSHSSKLRTIILKIMPHFVRKSRGPERRQFNDEEFLDFICGRINIPEVFLAGADKILDPGPLLRRLNHLAELEGAVVPLEDGLISGESLRRWLHTALKSQIVRRERDHLRQELREREGLGDSKRKHIAAMLYLADKESFELDGFGFSRIGSKDDYFIYKRTGEYVLMDYYAQNYRFPDCRVAVSTRGPLKPLVLESYKHPFLLHHAPKQEICLRDYNWPNELTAENIIRLLEDGINALMYGYDARRRNGYHSLDRTLYYVKTIEFEDYRV